MYKKQNFVICKNIDVSKEFMLNEISQEQKYKDHML